MLTKRLSQLAISDIQQLCDDHVSENRTLEFKSILPDKSDKGKFELAKDVAALANAGGGDIIFGIIEENAAASELQVICAEFSDAAIRRLSQVLDSSIDPAIKGLEFFAVQGVDGYILVVRVPISMSSPHRVIFNSNSRFVIRESGYVRDMSHLEIRTAFNRTGNYSDMVKDIRQNSINNIVGGVTWRPLKKGPSALLQIIPMSTVMGLQSIDVMKSYESYQNFMLSSWGGLSRILNLDGPIFYPPNQGEEIYSYTQIKRNGVIEGITFCGYSFNSQEIVPALSLALYVRETISTFVEELKLHDISGPAVICLTLIGVKDRKLEMGNNYYLRSNPIGDRNIMAIPDIYIDDINNEDLDGTATKPLLDVVWQAFGLYKCSYFDETGAWNNPQ